MRKCRCGCTEFMGHQHAYHDIVVDSNNDFVREIGIYESETPYGPFICQNCGAEYEELDMLAEYEEMFL